MSDPLAGGGHLLRLAARRDRWMAPVWVAVLTLTCYASAAATPGLYPTRADRATAVDALNASPGVVALYGPILDRSSLGELAMTKMTVTYSVLVAVMALFLVRRHTRSEEEDGRAELIGSTAVGRLTPLLCAVGFAAAVSLALGVLVATVNTLTGLPAAGSLAFGLTWAGTGLVGAAVAAVCCQLSASSRTCAALAAAVIAVLFVARAVGDTSDAGWLSWLSPFGWNTRVRAYGDTRWWVLGLHLATAVAGVAVAVGIRSRRDLGAGVLSARPGPRSGARWLDGPLGLAVKGHAAMLAGWTGAVAAMGLLFGAISPHLEGLVSDETARLLEGLGGAGALRDTMIASICSIAALLVCCFAVAVVTHAAADEHDGRTESVLATPVTRSRLHTALAVVTLGGVTWLLLVTGVALAVGVRGNSDHTFGRIVLSAIAQAPAAWVVVAVALLLFGIGARRAVLAWAVVVGFGTLGQIGELLGLPDAVVGLSPFTHVPHLPLDDPDPASALALAAITGGLLALGRWAYLRRDVG